MPVDLLIVGAGPAGLATAIYARRAGLSVTLVDKRRPPIDKACGEGLMPTGVALLTELGIHLPATASHPFVGIRYIDGERVAEGYFPSPGMGLRRTVLSEALTARAAALGADLRHACTVSGFAKTATGVRVDTSSGPLSARWLIGADGLHSAIRAQAGLARPWSGRRRFGVRQHFRIQPWSPFVEVYWVDGAEAYVTPVGPDEVGVAFLWDGAGGSVATLLQRFAPLAARLAGTTPTSSSRGAGPFRQGCARRYTDNIALVGDAAGYLDALTGEGVSLGFCSAQALVQVIARGAPLQDYERAYRRLSRAYYRSTEMVLWMGQRPPVRRAVIALLARHPRIFSRILALHGTPPTARPPLSPGSPRTAVQA